MRLSSKCILIIISIMLLAGMAAPDAQAGELMPMGEVAHPEDDRSTALKVKLGKMLFFDRRLSGDGTMTCASCHDPSQAFTDGLPISLSYPTTRNWRNSPTLINVGYLPELFHDGRAASLEEQALFPLMSAFEMNQNLDFMEEELRVVPEYVSMFREAFGAEIDRVTVAKAIAAFERTLVSKNVPLDMYLNGDKKALSCEAKKGLKLFTGKAGCSSCHFGAVLTDNDYHANGVPENPKISNDPRTIATMRFVAKTAGYGDYRYLNEDPGRYLVTKRQVDWKAFRTPSLLEVARTAPYMHNGVLETLKDVLEFYNAGGGSDNKELKPLRLTKSELKHLETFLVEGLTGAYQKFIYPEIP